MKDQYTKFLSKALWTVLFVFFLRCLISWQSLFFSFSLYEIFGYAGEAIGIAALLLGVYEKWLWRYVPFEETPVLKKRYFGTLKSTYDNIEREVDLEIKQTLLSINIVLISGESKSKSISSSIDSILGEQQLIFCYLNTPQAAVRNRSEIHYGTAMLCIENPNKLTGQYFTDRKTTGDMIFNAE